RNQAPSLLIYLQGAEIYHSRLEWRIRFYTNLNWHTNFFSLYNMKKYRHTFNTLSRQFIKGWLQYALAQPVDIDLPVVYSFVKDYIGFAKLSIGFAKVKQNLASSFAQEEAKETIEELIPQESYS